MCQNFELKGSHRAEQYESMQVYGTGDETGDETGADRGCASVRY